MGIWNMSIRLVAFLVVSYTIARIRLLLASAQKEVKTLQGFLPICAKCKKIRDDKGYWHQVESWRFRVCEGILYGLGRDLSVPRAGRSAMVGA